MTKHIITNLSIVNPQGSFPRDERDSVTLIALSTVMPLDLVRIDTHYLTIPASRNLKINFYFRMKIKHSKLTKKQENRETEQLEEKIVATVSRSTRWQTASTTPHRETREL